MQTSAVRPGPYTFLAVLKTCASRGTLSRGKIIHADIVKGGLDSGVFVGSALVDMYAKCGSLRDAHNIFDNLPFRDVVVWSAMLAGYAQHSHGLEALQLYEKMQKEGIRANKVTFVCILKACASIKALDEGKVIHADIMKHGLDGEVFVGNILVDMYAKCRSLKDAHKVFNKMLKRDVVSWNAIIAGYADHENCDEAFHLFTKMQEEGVEPNKITYLCVVKLFPSAADLVHGKLIHADIVSRRLETELFVGNSLVDMYAKCGSLGDACKVFDEMPLRDIVSWNAIIAGYAEYCFGEEAIRLFRRMKQECIRPDKVTFLCILKGCVSIKALDRGKTIHLDIMKHGQELDPSVGSTLIDMYAKCGCIEDSHNVFDRLFTRNVVSWNAIIAGYADCGFCQEALQMVEKMEQEGAEPDKVTSLSLLKACSGLAALDKGKLIHFDFMKWGLDSDIVTQNSLVDMYAKCGSLKDAQNVFDRMLVRDVITWSTMIAGYTEHGHGEISLHLFQRMRHERVEANAVTLLCMLRACSSIAALEYGQVIHTGIMKQSLDLDPFIGSTLVDMYGKCGSLVDAQEVFDKLPVQNVVSWSAIIGGYVENGHGEEALILFDEMQHEGIEANEVTYLCVLKACSVIAALDQGKLIHADIIEQKLDCSVSVGNTLVDMYAKCGSLENAHNEFDRLPLRDALSWNAMIGGYADHGHYNTAHKYFEIMQQECFRPDGVTFICLLSACSHAGLVCEGYQYFTSMKEDYDLTPTIKHYACMVDILGRAGQLEHAEELVLKMPFEPNTETFITLLGSCAKYGDVKIGRRTFESLLKFDKKKVSGYVLMSNLYAGNHLWEDTHKVKELREVQ